MNLKRGTPVIINDTDSPEARLVAVLSRFDDKRGIWHALYLSTYTNMNECYTAWRPTPISEFGMALEWDGDKYRCVPTGEPSIATYRDGLSRSWQDRMPDKLWQSRQKAAQLLRHPSQA